MKKILLLALLLPLWSCSNIYTDIGQIAYYPDQFKDTKTIKLVQHFRATKIQTGLANINTPLTANAEVTLRKKINLPAPKTHLELQISLPYTKEIQQIFYFQVDSKRFEYQFGEIKDYKLLDDGILEESQDDGSISTNYYDRSVNQVKATFTIPPALQQKIENARNQVVIRYYIDDIPYHISFSADKRASRLDILQEFLKIQNEADYVKHSRTYRYIYSTLSQRPGKY